MALQANSEVTTIFLNNLINFEMYILKTSGNASVLNFRQTLENPGNQNAVFIVLKDIP